MIIEANDVVQVTKPFKCCGFEFVMGTIYLVKKVRRTVFECPFCHKRTVEDVILIDILGNKGLPVHLMTNFGKCHA